MSSNQSPTLNHTHSLYHNNSSPRRSPHHRYNNSYRPAQSLHSNQSLYVPYHLFIFTNGYKHLRGSLTLDSSISDFNGKVKMEVIYKKICQYLLEHDDTKDLGTTMNKFACPYPITIVKSTPTNTCNTIIFINFNF